MSLSTDTITDPTPHSNEMSSTFDFFIGDRVKIGETRRTGTVVFLGNTTFAVGTWAGIYLDEACGKNDGAVLGTRYFHCPTKHGLFLRPETLRRISQSGTTISSTSSSTSNSRRRLRNVVSQLAAVVQDDAASLSSEKQEIFLVGDRVQVSDSRMGTIRYVGFTNFAKGKWAGIELDEPRGKNNGTVAGKRYFACKPGHGLFAQLCKIVRLDNVSTVTSTAQSCHESLLDDDQWITDCAETHLESLVNKEFTSSLCYNSSLLSRGKVKLGVNSLTAKEKENTSMSLLLDDNCTVVKSLRAENERLSNELDEQRRRNEDLRFQLAENEIERSNLEIRNKNDVIVIAKLEETLAGEKRELVDVKLLLENAIIQRSAEHETHFISLSSSTKALEDEKVKCQELRLELTNSQLRFNTTNDELQQALKQLKEVKSSLVESDKRRQSIAAQLASVHDAVRKRDSLISGHEDRRKELEKRLELTLQSSRESTTEVDRLRQILSLRDKELSKARDHANQCEAEIKRSESLLYQTIQERDRELCDVRQLQAQQMMEMEEKLALLTKKKKRDSIFHCKKP